ncbi:hypothetical protein Hanom_Chr02g00174191 [Helianthus anomalus]
MNGRPNDYGEYEYYTTYVHISHQPSPNSIRLRRGRGTYGIKTFHILGCLKLDKYFYPQTYVSNTILIQLNTWLVPVVCENCGLDTNGLLITQLVSMVVTFKLGWSLTLTFVKFFL